MPPELGNLVEVVRVCVVVVVVVVVVIFVVVVVVAAVDVAVYTGCMRGRKHPRWRYLFFPNATIRLCCLSAI